MNPVAPLLELLDLGTLADLAATLGIDAPKDASENALRVLIAADDAATVRAVLAALPRETLMSVCKAPPPAPPALDGRRVLVELWGTNDPETARRYGIKRWKVAAVDTEGAVERIELRPNNPECTPISVNGTDGDFRVIAELVRAVG